VEIRAGVLTVAIENVEYSVPFTWNGMDWVMHTEQISGAYIDTTTDSLHLFILLDPTGSSTGGPYWPWVDLISAAPVHYGTFQCTMTTDISAMILGTAAGFAPGMPNLAFAMYVCDENVKPFRGEIGIEPCQWGDPTSEPMSWLENSPTDPASLVGRIMRPYVAGPNVTHTLTWDSSYVKWEADGGLSGHVEKTYYNDTTCTSPKDTDGMFVRLMLSNTLNGGDFPPGLSQVEVVLSSFIYTPNPLTWGGTLSPNKTVYQDADDQLLFVITDDNGVARDISTATFNFTAYHNVTGDVLQKTLGSGLAFGTPSKGQIAVLFSASEMTIPAFIYEYILEMTITVAGVTTTSIEATGYLTVEPNRILEETA
jgi:hypothetical protein